MCRCSAAAISLPCPSASRSYDGHDVHPARAMTEPNEHFATRRDAMDIWRLTLRFDPRQGGHMRTARTFRVTWDVFWCFINPLPFYGSVLGGLIVDICRTYDAPPINRNEITRAKNRSSKDDRKQLKRVTI